LSKNGQPFSVEDYYAADPKTVQTLVADLEFMGYTVMVETLNGTDPDEWLNYDLIMTCSGDNISTLENTSVRNALISHVENGGRLIIEGGEVGYDYYSSNPFASTVLRINDWDGDESGSVTAYDTDHSVWNYPNPISGPISVAYDYWGDHDALDATNGGVRIGSWTSAASNASVIVYDDDIDPADGQSVFFCWNYAAMETGVREQLLQNAINWLLPSLTAVDEAPDSPPSTLRLAGNFPNPFNPKTTIRFELPSAGQAKLSVYDASGRLLRTLVDGKLPAGAHSALWDGKDEAGQSLASGIYLYRLSAGEQTLTRKMLLVK
jgi:hypothetical protein